MKWIPLLLCCLVNGLFAKVRLLTFHYNRPELLDLQYKAFNKFILDDYEVIVFNDAPNSKDEEAIRKKCELYGFQCVRYEQDWHFIDPLNDQIEVWKKNPDYDLKTFLGVYEDRPSQQPSIRHCHVIQYAMDHFGYTHDDIVALVDSDLFPIRPICIRELLQDVPIAGLQRWERGVEYLWVPFIAFDLRRLPDIQDVRFHVDVVDNQLLDTGSHMANYLRKHPEVASKKFPQTNRGEYYEYSLSDLTDLGYTQAEAKLIKALRFPFTVEFHMDNHFIHFGASSADLYVYKMKLKTVSKFIDTIVL